MLIIKIFFLFLLTLKPTQAQFSPGELIDPEKINSHFQEIKDKTSARGHDYSFIQLTEDEPISSQVLNSNFNNFKLIVPSTNIKNLESNKPVKASELNFNFNSINNKIMSFLSTRNCNIPNGVGTQTFNIEQNQWNSCILSSCNSTYHVENDACLPNIKSCSFSDGSGTGTQTWHGNGYNSCIASTCSQGYHLDGALCIIDSRSCSIENGVGEQSWNSATNTWNTNCLVKTCNEGYYPNEANNACILNNSIACSNQFDDSFNLIGYGFINYDYNNKTTSCKINSCINSSYSLNNGICECTNTNGCFVSLTKINSDIIEINSILNLSEQPNINTISTIQSADITTLNNNFNSLKKYDPNNTISALSSSSIPNNTWDSQVSEAKRLAQSYYNTCVGMTAFDGISDSSTCSLAKKLKRNLNRFNEYFPFYGDSQASYTLDDNDFVGSTTLNSLFTIFNNKTNKTNSLTTYTTNQTITSANINSNLTNLRLNIKQKLESMANTNYVSTPYVKTAIPNFNSNNTNKNFTVYFKIEDTSMKSVVANSFYNGTTCLYNEYCKTSFSSHNTSSLNLVDTEKTSLEDIKTNNTLKLIIDTAGSYVNGSTADFGCANADTFSLAQYNTWACDSGSGGTCSRWCYLGSCTNNPATTFNNWYNSHGKFQYTSWQILTGDLRRGCGGAYVYAYRTYFNYQIYHVGP